MAASGESPIPFGDMEAGEPDANTEAYLALRRNQNPLYISGFFNAANLEFQTLIKGEKLFIYGKKGTGKTALLRNVEADLKRAGFQTEFIVFRETIQQEEDLRNVPFPIEVPRGSLHESAFYLHAVKRIILTIMLNLIIKQGSNVDQGADEPWWSSFFQKLISSEKGQSISLALDSVTESITEGRKLLGINRDPNISEMSRLLKRQNDTLLRQVIPTPATCDSRGGFRDAGLM